MKLNSRDFMATVLAVLAAGIAYINLSGVKYALVSSNRIAVLVLVVLGLLTCAFGARRSAAEDLRGTTMLMFGSLGVLALTFGILGLVFSSQVLVLALAIIIVVMWLVSTLRHMQATV